MAAYGVKKCHRITEKDPLTLQEPVPYMNTIIIKKWNRRSHKPDRLSNLVHSCLYPRRV